MSLLGWAGIPVARREAGERNSTMAKPRVVRGSKRDALRVSPIREHHETVPNWWKGTKGATGVT